MGPKAPEPDVSQIRRSDATTPSTADKPIVTDQQFDSAMPPLSGDINAPLETMAPAASHHAASPAAFRCRSSPRRSDPPIPVDAASTLPPTGPGRPATGAAAHPARQFRRHAAGNRRRCEEQGRAAIRYQTVVKGFEKGDLASRFKALSALETGQGQGGQRDPGVRARAHEDEALAIRFAEVGRLLRRDRGLVDRDVRPARGIERRRHAARRRSASSRGGCIRCRRSRSTPSRRSPANLVRTALPLKVGDAIDAARIEGAEANVSLTLPQQGYPFVKVGQRDILLDDQSPKATGAYTLPVDTGARSSFGKLVTSGDPVFKLDHLERLPAVRPGAVVRCALVDDLRDALVATSLFSTVSVEPQPTDRVNPDGTQAVDLLVRPGRGPYKSLAGTAGYSTGEGFKLEGSFTNRNVFSPEGALIFTAIGGTQEQGLSATFKRANAGKRDRTVTLVASVDHSSYDAFQRQYADAVGRISYDSTPIWQKKFTYAYGFELVGTNESVYDFGVGDRVRRNYFIAALPGLRSCSTGRTTCSIPPRVSG